MFLTAVAASQRQTNRTSCLNCIKPTKMRMEWSAQYYLNGLLQILFREEVHEIPSPNTARF